MRCFFPNDHRVGFRKQKKTAGWKSSIRSRSGAENFVLLLLFFNTLPPGCDSYYTKKVRHQNQHGRDSQGQSAIPLPCFGPRVALFFAHAAVCALSLSTFFIFENFENVNVLTVRAQTGALAYFRRQILHFRAHRKCTDWSTCTLSATNPAFSSSP